MIVFIAAPKIPLKPMALSSLDTVATIEDILRLMSSAMAAIVEF